MDGGGRLAIRRRRSVFPAPIGPVSTIGLRRSTIACSRAASVRSHAADGMALPGSAQSRNGLFPMYCIAMGPIRVCLEGTRIQSPYQQIEWRKGCGEFDAHSHGIGPCRGRGITPPRREGLLGHRRIVGRGLEGGRESPTQAKAFPGTFGTRSDRADHGGRNLLRAFERWGGKDLRRAARPKKTASPARETPRTQLRARCYPVWRLPLLRMARKTTNTTSRM